MKNSRPSLEYTRRGFGVRDGRLRLVGGITIPVVWYWYASFVVTRETRPAPDAAIGATKRILVETGERAGRKVLLVPSVHTTTTIRRWRWPFLKQMPR